MYADKCLHQVHRVRQMVANFSFNIEGYIFKRIGDENCK